MRRDSDHLGDISNSGDGKRNLMGKLVRKMLRLKGDITHKDVSGWSSMAPRSENIPRRGVNV